MVSAPSFNLTQSYFYPLLPLFSISTGLSSHLLAVHRQSIEAFILNPDGTGNYIPKPEGWIVRDNYTPTERTDTVLTSVAPIVSRSASIAVSVEEKSDDNIDNIDDNSSNADDDKNGNGDGSTVPSSTTTTSTTAATTTSSSSGQNKSKQSETETEVDADADKENKDEDENNGGDGEGEGDGITIPNLDVGELVEPRPLVESSEIEDENENFINQVVHAESDLKFDKRKFNKGQAKRKSYE